MLIFFSHTQHKHKAKQVYMAHSSKFSKPKDFRFSSGHYIFTCVTACSHMPADAFWLSKKAVFKCHNTYI